MTSTRKRRAGPSRGRRPAKWANTAQAAAKRLARQAAAKKRVKQAVQSGVYRAGSAKVMRGVKNFVRKQRKQMRSCAQTAARSTKLSYPNTVRSRNPRTYNNVPLRPTRSAPPSTKAGTGVFRGREKVLEIFPQSDPERLHPANAIMIAPGASGMARLDHYARLYDLYRIKALRARFLPSYGNTYGGFVQMGIDYGPYSSCKTVQDVQVLADSARGPLGQGFWIQLDPQYANRNRWMMTANTFAKKRDAITPEYQAFHSGAAGEHDDAHMSVAAIIQVACSAATDALPSDQPLGHIEIDYEVEFAGPNSPDESLAQVATRMSHKDVPTSWVNRVTTPSNKMYIVTQPGIQPQPVVHSDIRFDSQDVAGEPLGNRLFYKLAGPGIYQFTANFHGVLSWWSSWKKDMEDRFTEIGATWAEVSRLASGVNYMWSWILYLPTQPKNLPNFMVDFHYDNLPDSMTTSMLKLPGNWDLHRLFNLIKPGHAYRVGNGPRRVAPGQRPLTYDEFADEGRTWNRCIKAGVTGKVYQSRSTTDSLTTFIADGSNERETVWTFNARFNDVLKPVPLPMSAQRSPDGMVYHLNAPYRQAFDRTMGRAIRPGDTMLVGNMELKCISLPNPLTPHEVLVFIRTTPCTQGKAVWVDVNMNEHPVSSAGTSAPCRFVCNNTQLDMSAYVSNYKYHDARLAASRAANEEPFDAETHARHIRELASLAADDVASDLARASL